MAGAVTRKSLTDFKQQLNEDSDFIFIPVDTFTRILDENKETQDQLFVLQQQMLDTQQSTNEALTKIATALESINTSNNERSANLLSKMDDLISKISSSNTTLNSTQPTITEESLKQLAYRKCNKEQQIRRANELSQYFTDLLANDPPYAHRQYRTKVGRNTPEFEKKIHSDNTIQKVKQQIHLMQERVKNWTDEVDSVQEEITGALAQLDTHRADKFNRFLKEESDKQLNEWTDKFASYKRTIRADIESGASQYLLKYADEDNSDSDENVEKQPKNVNSRDIQARAKGGRGGPKFGGNNRSKRNFNNNNYTKDLNNNNRTGGQRNNPRETMEI